MYHESDYVIESKKSKFDDKIALAKVTHGGTENKLKVEIKRI